MTEATLPPESSEWPDSRAASELEQRVARLEEAVAAIVDTSEMEERVVERVRRQVAPAAQTDNPGDRPLTQTPIGAGFVALADPPQAAAPFAKGLLAEMASELRLFFRMMRDPLYHLTWAGKLLPLLALFFITLWPLTSAWLGPLGKTLWLYPFDLLVAYIGLKALGRELRRYELQNAWRKR